MYWSVDPLGARFLVPYDGQIIWRTISIPFTLSSTILLTFYWFETTSVRPAPAPRLPLSFKWSVFLTDVFLENGKHSSFVQCRSTASALLLGHLRPVRGRNYR